MQSQYGLQVLPPDEATPFFDKYVLEYAFPTIALICRCVRRPVYPKTTKLVYLDGPTLLGHPGIGEAAEQLLAAPPAVSPR